MVGETGAPTGIGGLSDNSRSATPTNRAVLPKDAPKNRTLVDAPPDESSQDDSLLIRLNELLDGRYRLDKVVGRGGTATVYRGTDTTLDRPVAVKVFHPHSDDPMTAARQSREIRLLSGVNHPHLVTVYDASARSPAAAGPADGDRSYLVTEFVDGSALSALLAGGPLTPDQVADIGLGIAEALDVVHGLGVVHRDVKPGNVLVSESGEVKLADFGIAREVEGDPVTRTNDVVGTAHYLSPEQARGHHVGSPSDIYSLGLVLLECLTGRREFPGAPVQAAVARLLREPEIPTDLPAPWPELLSAMTHRDPGERPTAADVADTLASARSRPSDGGTTTTAPVLRTTRSSTMPAVAAELDHSRVTRLRPVMLGILVAAAAIIAVVVGVIGADTRTGPVGTSDAATSVVPATSVPATPTAPAVAPITVTVATPLANPAVPEGVPVGGEPPADSSPTPITSAPADPAVVVTADPASSVEGDPPHDNKGNGGNGNSGNGNGGGNSNDKSKDKGNKPDK